MTGRRVAAAIALIAVAAAGCTSSGGTTPTTAPVPTPAPSTSSAPVTPSAVVPTTAVATPSSTAPTSRSTSPRPSTSTPSPRPSSTAPTATRPTRPPQPTTTATLTAPPANGGTCQASQLRFAAVRGGASQGREYAAVSFTNTAKTRCTLRGYPAAQLLRGGSLLGNPAAHDTTGTVRTLTVRPKAMVQAVLSAVSTCQSPLSDHVRVIVPGQRAPVDVPIELRACSLTIGPVDLP